MTRKLWVAMALFVPLAATLALAQPSASFGAAKRLLAGTLELERGDPHSGLSTITVHAFQGRTVDNVIAAMEARHLHLTTQKSFYVAISRARYRAELVTDDAAERPTQLQVASTTAGP